jgi:hypothetical protein
MTIENNTVWQDWKFLEDKPTLGPSTFTGNILKGPVGDVEANVTFKNNMMESAVKGDGTLTVRDVFLKDGVAGDIAKIEFDHQTHATIITTKKAFPRGVDLAGRSVRISQDHDGGQWRVIKSARGSQFVIWGHIGAITGKMEAFDILRSFTLRPDAPKGIGAGAR